MAKNLLAVVMGLTLALCGVEGGARILADLLGVSSYMQYDEKVGWKAKPGAVKRHRHESLGFDVTYSINGRGLRGPLYDFEKPKGIYRIVLLGDSNGFGWGIADGKYFAALLDEEIDSVEVVNFSLSGYGTDQQYLRFVEEGIAYHPDLVIVQVTPNDFEEIQHPFFNGKAKPQFVLTDQKEIQLINVPVKPMGPKAEDFYDNSLPVPFREWLGWHSYAYNYFNDKYYMLKRRTSRSKSAELSRQVFSTTSVLLFKKIIGLLKVKLDEIGSKGLIVHASKEVSENKYLSDCPLPVLDLYPVVEASEREHGVALYYADGVHWNELGHRVIAEEIKKVIQPYLAAMVSPKPRSF